MSFEVNELRPIPVFYKSYELKPFTLNCEVWAIHNYGSIKKMWEQIQKPNEKSIALYDVLSYLTGKTKKELIYHGVADNKLNIEKTVIENSRLAYTAIKSALDNSSPLIKNPERAKAKQQMLEAQGAAKPPCYGVYYDRLAKRYGYDLDQFYNLTLRQLLILLNVINEESYDELALQAKLHGREIKERMEVDDITPEQEAEQDNAAQAAYEALMRRYREANNGQS